MGSNIPSMKIALDITEKTVESSTQWSRRKLFQLGFVYMQTYVFNAVFICVYYADWLPRVLALFSFS